MDIEWIPMTQVIPPVEIGVVKIKHVAVSDKEASFASMRMAMHGERDMLNAGSYAHLLVNGKLMMSDTAMEKRTNKNAIYSADGDILIAGLGLGMILIPILKKEAVRSVTVVEKYRDVIDAVAPSLARAFDGVTRNKLTIVHADIFDWKPAKGVKFDCIYFDIWPEICTDNLEEMATLHQKFKGRLKGKRWMDSWCKDQLKYRKAQEKRCGW